MSENQILTAITFVLLLQAIMTTCVVGAVAAAAWRFLSKKIKVDVFTEEAPKTVPQVPKVEPQVPKVEPQVTHQPSVQPVKPWPRTPRPQIKGKKCYHCGGDIIGDAVDEQSAGTDDNPIVIRYYECGNCGRRSGFPA